MIPHAFFHAFAGLILLAAEGPTLEFPAVVKKVDPDQQLLVVTAGSQERSLRVPEGAKILDAAGRELPDRLRAKELREGATITLVARREEGRMVLLAIRLGGKAAKPRKPPADQTSQPAAQQDTSQLTPITDLGPREYHGFQGGLYPEGKNARPAGHEAAGIRLARQVQPLDADGKPSPSGKIVLLGIGFSNTVQAFNGLMRVAQADREVNPNLVLVNGAVGGMSASMVQDPEDGNRGTKYWSTVDERLKAAGVTRAQVQVVWIKETNPAPHAGGFPKYVQDLEGQLVKIVQILPRRFPNVKLAYLSSRTYGGWAKPKAGGGEPGNSEPFSYESGFAVKWLIQRQIEGEPALSFDATQGLSRRAPWLSWAAYLWTNGATPRSDGAFFTLDDFVEQDRMHESPTGQQKVGRLLLEFFKKDPTAKGWFCKAPASGGAAQ